MAREFNGTNERISFGDVPTISDSTIISVSVWAWLDTDTADHLIVGNFIGGSTGFIFFFDDVGASRTNAWSFFVSESAGAGGTNVRVEGATNSGATGVWTHLFGSFQANTASGIQLWINGVEDANSPVDTTGIADFGLTNNAVTIGEGSDGGRDHDGRVAELAFWNRILTDSEIVTLSKGYSPAFIPNGLFSYIPLIGRNSPETDIKGLVSGTLTGTSNVAHPRIIYPSSYNIAPFAAGGAPPATVIPNGYMTTNTKFWGM